MHSQLIRWWGTAGAQPMVGESDFMVVGRVQRFVLIMVQIPVSSDAIWTLHVKAIRQKTSTSVSYGQEGLGDFLRLGLMGSISTSGFTAGRRARRRIRLPLPITCWWGMAGAQTGVGELDFMVVGSARRFALIMAQIPASRGVTQTPLAKAIR